MYKAIIGGQAYVATLILFLALFGSVTTANATCSSYAYTLTNGTTADASQVMANFNCAALTSGATINNPTITGTVIFPGSGTGINSAGMTLTGGNVFYGGSGIFNVAAGISWGTVINATYNSSLSAFNFALFSTGPIVNYIGSINSGNGTSTNYNTSSDIRLKNWQIPQTDYRDAIRNIWVGNFDWKRTGDADFGVLAQQAYKYFPFAVSKPANDNGSCGTAKAEAGDCWEADYGRLAPLALWGTKDLYRITDSQADRIVALDKQVESYKKQVALLQHANEVAAAKIKVLQLQQSDQIRQLQTEFNAIRRQIRVQTAQR